jgi:hypothetical protein
MSTNRHLLYVHDGEGWDRCFCGWDQRECAGLDVCGLADFSWLPLKITVEMRHAWMRSHPGQPDPYPRPAIMKINALPY